MAGFATYNRRRAEVMGSVRRLQDRLRATEDHRALTPREQEIVRLVARGFTNREIGERLGISPATVAVYLHSVFIKSGLRSRREIKWCLDGGLVLRDGKILSGGRRPIRFVSVPVA